MKIKMNQRKSGVILSYISQMIHILSGLIYTPIMLRLLGQSEYGLYQLVYSTVSYLSLLSFGFTASYMRFYSRAKASKDEGEVGRLNGMFITIFMIMAIVCLFCGMVMVANIESIFAEGLTANEYSIAKILMTLMVVNLALTFPNSVFDAFSSAHERFFFQKLLVVLQNLMNPFLALPLLLLGYGSVAMVSVTTFLTVAKLTTNIWFSIKKLQVKVVFNGFHFHLLKEMWVFTFFIFLNQIIDQINWNVGKFLLGRLSGTAAVAIFGLGTQINSMYLQLSTSISNVFVPRVNQIVATTNDNRELTKLFAKVGRIQFIVLSLVLSGFIFFGKEFMIFWGGEGYGNSYYVVLLLIIPVTVPLIQNLGVEIQRAKNMHKARSMAYLFMAAINIFISIPLINTLGSVGAAVGTCFSLVAGNIVFMNWYYQAKIGIDIVYFWKEIAKFVPGFILPIVTGIAFNYLFEMNSLLEIAGLVLIYAMVFGASMYLFSMNEEERQIVKGPLRRIIKKRDGRR
ncbi:O-antigen/teichoic acid export membrane protein [Lachnospiraceae bacterium PM6-15]|uniref:Oligosaccharide flippase family protein n=1 Tax=Ohessyouella blattaphilus TaxID=2949333 RepID=A0ABT1EFK7_9FIRM|nr:oligosaccharide flippase family protein [Ohessyouella blattaphilus]MCP1109492.1 oligosaccharide flippase family protein [Ohessyouella blattaphilus]MCR8562886.1 oligosaccharide flippase family protein [Ohessyouella blattaphilus]